MGGGWCSCCCRSAQHPVPPRIQGFVTEWWGGWTGRRQPGSAQLRPTLRVLPELRREEGKEERGGEGGGRADGVMLKKP